MIRIYFVGYKAFVSISHLITLMHEQFVGIFYSRKQGCLARNLITTLLLCAWVEEAEARARAWPAVL